MQTITSRTQVRKAPLTDQIILAIVTGIAFFLVAAGASLIGFEWANSGKIFPGVWVGGVELSGLTAAEANQLVNDTFRFPQTGRIFLQDRQQAWQVTPAELGLYFDPESTVSQAYAIGRSGSIFTRLLDQWHTWRTPINFSPLYIYDQRQSQRYLTQKAAQINTPVVEANVTLNGLEVQVRSGQTGRELDVPASLKPIAAQVQSLQDGVVPLVVIETQPMILDASAQAELARQILSAPLELYLPDATGETLGPWTFDVKTLAGMLTVERVKQLDGSEKFEVAVDSAKLRTFLTNLAPALARDPQNGRFTFNDTTRQLEVIQPAIVGRSLDIEGTIKAVQGNLARNDHTVPLTLKVSKPPASNDTTAEELGIRELIHQEVSYFYGSSAARIQNITAAASKFHGVLVAPGAVFSMADTIGDISLDNGFAEALIIFNGQTVKGVGGGVCQVSTTLFRTVFFGGYPIVQRFAHAYRVSYYEKVAGNRIDARLAGLDATVFVPLVDFKFKNDSSAWLLMETYVNPRTATLTWKFYSTADGRKVTWDTTGLTNIVPAPDPVYRENPDLPSGKIVHIDYAVEGADVAVSRTISRDGQVVSRDVVRTHYVPWPDQFEYGPGTELPTPAPKDQ